MEIKKSIIREITPISDEDCFYVMDRVKSSFSYPIHCHDDFELNFVENAAGAKRIVGDSSEIIGNYDLVLITGKELEHAWLQNECESTNIHEITIQFKDDGLVSHLLDKKRQFFSIKKMFEDAQCGISFSTSAIMHVYNLLQKLTKAENDFYSMLTILELLYELSISGNYKTLSTTSFAKANSHVESRRIQKVQAHITSHYKSDIRLSHLATMVGMTETSFSRFFKLRTGKTVSDYITDIRIGHACRMLIDTQRSIAEIGYECGFNNLSNFNRIFRKKKDCVPSEFRDSYRKTRLIV
jgi:AraC-like DNA-binding protein